MGAIVLVRAPSETSDASSVSPWPFGRRTNGPAGIRVTSVGRPGQAQLRDRHAPASFDAPDDARVHLGAEGSDNRLRGVLRRDDREAHPHVKCLIHLRRCDAAEHLEGPERGGYLERVRNPELDVGLEPDQVPHPAAGDVGHPVGLRATEGPQDRTDVNGGRLEEFLPPGPSALWEGIEDRQGRVREDAAGQRQAVGVDPGARKADDHVARPDRAAVDDLRLEDGPEAGPREVDLPDEFRDDGDLSTDDRDVRELRALAQAGLGIGKTNAQATKRAYFKGTRADGEHVKPGAQADDGRPPRSNARWTRARWPRELPGDAGGPPVRGHPSEA